MANLSNVITVALLPEGQSLARDNMNVVAVITSDDSVVNTATRYKAYTDSASVEADFGTTSDVSQYAQVFFAQAPNPVQMGGLFIVGFWRAASETVAATSGVLTGAQLSEAVTIPAVQAISDGSFDITIDGSEENISGLDFRVVTDLDGIVTLIDTALTGGTATLVNDKIIITSDTTGASSTMTYASAGASGTFVGDILDLSDGSGASLEQGADADALDPETKVEALTAIKADTNMKGACFIDNLIDADVPLVATWAQANSTLIYHTFGNSTYLDVDITNPAWTVKLSKQTYFRMLYSKAGNRKMSCAYMSRMHTVNFSALNSAITMNLKELRSIAGEEYSQTEINDAKTVGLDIYTTFKNVPKLLTSGANDFTDNSYNLIAFIDAMQTDMFNLLGTTATKIAQTIKGTNQIGDRAEETCEGFVRANVLGAGTWSSPDTFGDIDVFNRSIEQKGYYVLVGSLADQLQSERAARQSPVVQVAIKNAGAIHSVSIIINFNL